MHEIVVGVAWAYGSDFIRDCVVHRPSAGLREPGSGGRHISRRGTVGLLVHHDILCATRSASFLFRGLLNARNQLPLKALGRGVHFYLMSSQKFSQLAAGAFPFSHGVAAQKAANTLGPFVDPSYSQPLIRVQVLGRTVSIPSRIHFLGGLQAGSTNPDPSWVTFQCLCSRSTDGYLRQLALRAILTSADAAAIPFVVLLAGEYVVEIINDMVFALPNLDRTAYASFVRENRQLMRTLKAKATSYWDCYYRALFPDRFDYPGLTFLREIERWAA